MVKISVTENSKEILIHLQELSALLVDSINGFHQLEQMHSDTTLTGFIKSSHKQSKKIHKELNREISRYGGEIKTKGTLKGAVNHLFMSAKSELLHADIDKLLKNIEVCEEINIDRYNHVLKTILPPKLRGLLTGHLGLLNERLEIIKVLKKNFA